MTLLLLAPVIAIAVVGATAFALQLQRRGQRRLIGTVIEHAAPPPSPVDEPSLLYFTGVHCSVCHVAQRPALLSLQERLGGVLRMREIDVADDPALARKYRVLSLPTTIVLRADHSVAAVNTGFAGADTLERQLVDAGLRVAQLA